MRIEPPKKIIPQTEPPQKKGVGDIPPTSNPDIEERPGEAPSDKPGATPDTHTDSCTMFLLRWMGGDDE